MKLTDLVEDEFQNKQHSSITNEINYVKNKVKALSAEREHNMSIKHKIRTVYHDRYMTTPHSPPVLFTDSSEFKEYCNESRPISMKMQKYSNIILQLTDRLKYLKSRKKESDRINKYSYY